MNAGLFDVLHDAADNDVFAVGQRVHVNFSRRLEEMVDQYWPLLRVFDRLFHVAVDGFVVVGDDHRASAEHVRRPHQHGIADPIGIGQGFFDAGGRGSRGLRDFKLFQEPSKALAIFRQVDALGRSTDDGDAGALERQAQD